MNKFRYIPVLVFLALAFSCPPPVFFTSFTGAQRVMIQNVVDKVDGTQITNRLDEIEMGRESYQTANLTLCQTRMISNFTSWGYIGIQTQPVEDPYLSGRFINNIIVTKPGTNPGLPPVLVTAHWDSLEGVSMDDNASGVAALQEIARLLSAHSTERTVVFVLFTFEEDQFVGSYLYVDNLGFTPDSVFNFDCIGYTGSYQYKDPIEDIFLGLPDTGDFIAALAIENSRELAFDYCNAIRNFVPALKYYLAILPPNVEMGPIINNAIRSDHLPFWQKNMKALFLTDTANMRNPNYHKTSDTFGTLDLVFLANVTKATFATVLIRANIIL